jgi:F420-0:gamma-glutamyl ligase
MERMVGTQVRGIRAPIIKQGDDLVSVVIGSLEKALEPGCFVIKDRDVIGITESFVARSQGNYVTVDDIADEIREKFPGEIGVVSPILSRNRFSLILKGIARGADKVFLQLNYPCDEVGNHLMDVSIMDEHGLDPWQDVLTEYDYRRLFGNDVRHPFTGIDYIKMYKELAVNDNITILLANDPRCILEHTRNVLTADIHTRKRTQRILLQAGAKLVLGLEDLCSSPVEGRGYNPEYGLLGSNKAGDEKLKLFPRDGQAYVERIQSGIFERWGRHVEVMIYGDGAFKDPVGKIWELADPVVSPAYTKGLTGTPNELKLKYLADDRFSALDRSQLESVMKQTIREKENGPVDSMDSQGTTPRQLTDILGSLCDLTSGSGDKGTPIIHIQGYFDNFATE